MTDAEALQLLIKKKELGITDEELELFKQSLTQPVTVPDLDPEDIMKGPSPLEGLTDQELLYFATPYFDELQARKEAMTKQIKEDEATNGKD